MTIGKYLYDHMVGKEWGQAELAEHANLPRQAVADIILGKRAPTLDELAALIGALN